MNILLEANLDTVQTIKLEEEKKEKGVYAYILLLNFRTKLRYMGNDQRISVPEDSIISFNYYICTFSLAVYNQELQRHTQVIPRQENMPVKQLQKDGVVLTGCQTAVG